MKTAIIIGAGPAGLTAAYKLLKETDIKPIIIEESDSVGGISKTVSFRGNKMDLGGHRFFTKNEEVNNLWNEFLNKQSLPSKDEIILNKRKNYRSCNEKGNPEKFDDVFLLRNRVSRIFYKRKFFDYPIKLSLKLFINMGFVDTIKSGVGFIGSMIKKRDEKSLEDFYINKFGKQLYSMFFEDYTEKLWGVHPSKLSADWGAQRIKGVSIKQILKDAFTNKKSNETSLIEEFEYPKYGPGQLFEKMKDEIIKMGGEFKFNEKVESIETKDDKIISVNNKYIGDYFISSMPIKDLVQSIGDTENEVYNDAINLPYRDFITVGVLLKKLNLKNKTNIETINDLIPDNWIYMQERDLKIGRLQIFNNWSPYMVKDLENTVWMGCEYFCNENDKYWNMSKKEFIKMALNELIKAKIIKKEDVICATQFKVKKAYPAYFGSYEKIEEIKNYLNGFENLYCVGRNGQHRYNNMDHSMLTSIEAVRLIKENNKDKSILWAVNTEKEYHESK